MTSPEKSDALPHTIQQQDFNIARINRLVADLEHEVARASGDTPHLQDLKEEIETLKSMLESPDSRHGGISEGLHSTRTAFQKFTQTVEGEVLRDSPVIAEMGRILGLV